MAIDPSIYGQIKSPNYLEALSNGLAIGEQIGDRKNRLADLASQRELRSQQVTQGRNAIAAYPQQQAEAQRMAKQRHIQELSFGLSQGLDPQHGIDKESLIFQTMAEARRRGLDNNDVQQLLTPMNSGKDVAAMSTYYLNMANPQEAMKSRFGILGRKPAPFKHEWGLDANDNQTSFDANDPTNVGKYRPIPRPPLVQIGELGNEALNSGLDPKSPEGRAFVAKRQQDRIDAEKEKQRMARESHAADLAEKKRKAGEGKPISNVDARSIDRSIVAASNSNAALQLLDDADALYSTYASGRDEPILGPIARAGAVVGIGDEKKAIDYETGVQIEKDLGIIKLGLIGGSDTERELKVAIETSPSPDKRPSTNKKIIDNQRKAISILQAEPDFKTEWVNKNGSLSKLDAQTGEPYGKAWRKYQIDNFRSPTSAINPPAEVSERPLTPAGKTKSGASVGNW